MADKSFFVHLQSLSNFAQELQTQLAGMATPINHLDTLSSVPMALGDFGEATSLSAANQAAVAEMTELLGQVRQAITFAENITSTVATGYQQADQDVAGGMQVDTGNTMYSGSSTQDTQDAMWAASSGTLDASTGLSGNSGGEGGWT